MKKPTFEKELCKLGLQKAELERCGVSDLHFHCSLRTKAHRAIGKLMQAEIDSGKKRKDVISESSEILRKKFPDVRGFSKTSLGNMLNIYNKFKDDPELESLSDEIPVSQNCVISSLCKTRDERKLVLESSVFGELQSKRKLEKCLRECRKKDAGGFMGFFSLFDGNSADAGCFSLSRELVFDVPGKDFGRESVKSLLRRKIPDIDRKIILSGFVRVHVKTE